MKKHKDMKFTKQLRFAALSVVCMSVLASCIKDPVGPIETDLTSTRLAISLPGLQNGMKTRAGVPGDYDKINDLNIFITSGNEILHRLYIDELVADWAAPEEDDEGITGDLDDNYNYVVTYPGTWLDAQDGVHRRGANNYIVVANYGSKIEEGDAENVAELRALEVVSPTGWVDQTQNVMFGESGVEVTLNGDGTSGNKSVKLERIAAMITLVIDGSGLNPGVTITPVNVSLHNVPTRSYIGQKNIVTTTPNQSNPAFGTTPRQDAISPTGESYSVRDLWNPITSADGVRGGHYGLVDMNIDGVDRKVPNFDASTPLGATVIPFFMYENYHGENFGAAETNQVWKRPAPASANQTSIEQYDDACSYLQVTARYNAGNQHGEITYRVFLGADELRDFNVLRNNYYLVTLNLRNTGIGEGDASWRLATNMSTMGVSESDFILNGGGEIICIDVTDGETPSNMFVDYDGGGQNWVYMITVQNGNVTGWMPLGQNSSGFPLTSQDQIFLYVSPMIRPTTWDVSGQHVRQVTFLMRSANESTKTPFMTITQYEPVAVRLADYAGYPEIVAKVGDLGLSMTGTLYIDRVDGKELLPWGFDGTVIGGEGVITARGFTNGDNLMVNYGGVAANYLPQGKEGSAMMHAAFLRYYQRQGVPPNNMYPGPGNNLSITTIRDFTPTTLPYDFAIPSVQEWELLDMMNSAIPFDFVQGQNIPSFFPYWTSTAVEGSDDESYVFNLAGMTTEAGASRQLRTTPTRYRMIHYR